MKNKTRIGIALFSLLLFAWSCSENNTDKTTVEVIQSVNSVENAGIESSEDFYFFLPSPIQIAHILKKSGLIYEPGITNDPKKYDQYQTRISGLLNLGVYTGDLAYCIMNDRIVEGREYAAAIKKVSDLVDLSEVYNPEKSNTNIEAAVENRDSLINFIISTQENLNEYAENSNQASILLVTFTGAWIETIYLGSHSENKSPENVAETLTEQMGILKNLISGLKTSYPDNDEIGNLVNLLTDFKNSVNIEKNSEGVQIISFEQFKILENKITSIRTYVTNN